MELSEQNILFFPRTMRTGGTEKVVIQLCEILSPYVHSIAVCSCGGVAVEQLEKMGITHITIPDITDRSPKTIFAVANTLRRIIREERITVIHTHHRMAAFYVAMLKLYKNCVYINTSHNTFTDKKTLTKYAYRHAHLIACGEAVKRNLLEVYGIPATSVAVIRNAVREFTGNIVSDETIQMWHDRGYFVVGNVGRLTEQKGMKYFLMAIPEIVRTHPEARFMVIGSGEEEQMLREMASDLKIEEYLYFTGNRKDVQNLMSQLDLLVLSSLWEGMPLTPLEAFSVKKTVVATAVDGTVEIIRDGENGYLIPPRDPNAISEKVVDLIEHAERRKNMEKNGYQIFLRNFSYSVFSEKIIEYYQSL